MADEESANDPQLLGLLHLGWDTAVFIVKPIATAVGNVLYYLAFALLFVFKLLWRPLEFLLLPLLYLGDFLVRCAAAPFRFLAKFETLYIFLGIAAVIGVTGGILVSLLSGTLQGMLGLDAESTPSARERTVGDWRRDRRKHDKPIESLSASSEGMPPRKSGKKRKGKAGKTGNPPTILEELDSDY